MLEDPGGGAAWKPPDSFEEYVLERRLGEGGMGQVYVARDQHLDRQVAIKFVRTFDDPIARARFRNEAKAMARLQHPNVVTIHRVSEVQGCPFVVYELIHGTPLDQIDKPVAPGDFLSIAVDLARGLAAAHRHGVLHRDIKPSNAILGADGVTKLLDFGLAKLASRDRRRAADGGTGKRSVLSVSGDIDPELMATELIETGPTHTKSPEAPHPNRSEPLPVDLTDDNAIMGTPLFLAPELWNSQRASEATDIYAYGAVLYLLATGRPPIQGATILELSHAVVHGPPVSLTDVTLPDGRLGMLIETCLARNPRDRPESVDAICATLEEIASKGRRTRIPQGNPYRGLLAFQSEHRDLFFGRDVEIASTIERLRVESLAIVAGDSGVGKSSFCRAGVIPEIVEGALGGEGWRVGTIIPGQHPMTEVARFFREALDEPQADFESRLADEWTDVGRDIERARDRQNVLIFIDQLEELVTISDPEEAARVGQLLERALSPIPEVKILCTVRSDFLTRIASVTGLRRALSRCLYLLPPLSREGVRAAIEGPAHAHGFAFEDPNDVDSLCDQVSGTASLPLLQFALAELWETRDVDRKLIPAGSLESIGGLEGALERHADGVLARLRPEERRRAQSILLQLASQDLTRVRRPLEELGLSGEDDTLVLEALIGGRLLIATEGPSGPQVEVAHEALLRGWSTLRDWLDERRDAHNWIERCESAASEWKRGQGGADLLWGPGLVERTRQLELDSLSPSARTFLRQSRRSVRRRKLLRIGSALGVVASVVIALLVYSAIQERRAEREIRAQQREIRAELAEADAESERIESLRGRALALFDAGESDDGNAAWAGYLERERELDLERLRWLEAAAERTYLVAPERKQSARLLAEILVRRARLAERRFQWRQAEAFVERAQRLSPRVTSPWVDPVAVELRVTPPGAAITLERYDTAEHPWLPIEIASGSKMELPPGSYRFRIARDGHREALLPFVVHRQRPVSLQVSLPPADLVPSGAIFVPGGTTYLGSDHPEEMRRNLFRSAPLRERVVGSFLMSRQEVTFGDYATYLESLADVERRERFPRGGLWGPVELERIGAGSYRFRDGEVGTTELQTRDDWRRLPLMGISAQDATAYTAWLDETGRFPGARLCQVREWVRAARGADRRTYPHGAMLADGEANTYYEGGRNRAAPVGSYEASKSPFDALDMAGNVFEIVTDDEQFLIAGGSFEYSSVNATVVNAAPATADARGAGIGLRVCADPPAARP